MRIAINGFGRIGKTVLRILLSDYAPAASLNCVAINIGAADIPSFLYALRYDSIMGPLRTKMQLEDTTLHIGTHRITIIQELDAARLPWNRLAVDWVIESTGAYTKRDRAELHLQAGARNVLLSAPAEGDDRTIIMGCNEQEFSINDDRIISLGSCTTNATVPLLHAALAAAPVAAVSVSTAHAYTNTQSLVDRLGGGDELRHLRAAPLNSIPAPTGAAQTIIRVLPSLQNRLIASAIRIPVPIVSIVEATIMLETAGAEQAILTELVRRAAEQPTIIGISDEQLVSSDFRGDTRSVIVDLPLCLYQERMVKLVGWYDNEYGYAARIIDFLTWAGR